MSQPMPGCEAFADRFAALVADDDAALRAHAAECAACRREWERTRGAIDRARDADPARGAEPRAGLHARILAAVDEAAAPRPRIRAWRWASLAALPAACALAWLALRPPRPPVAPVGRAHPSALEQLDTDDDPLHAIDDLTPDEVERVRAFLEKGA